MSYMGVERDPSWVEWAENETIARLKDQLRARRRSDRESGGERSLPSISMGSAVSDLARSPMPTSLEPKIADHPERTHISALSEPPGRDGPEWHDWAEAQTILRLQQRRRSEEQVLVIPAPAPSVAIEPTRRTVRVHHENLKAVGI